jgi:quinolinate synthase
MIGIDLAAEIRELKRERNAVILAHNYQTRDIQEVADFVGDSLGLSYRAEQAGADVIAFCGVHFMAETAKIVNPSKTVVLPDLDAGCSLSDSCQADALENYLRDRRDRNFFVVAYINCSAAVKALSDVICTSGNAVRIAGHVPADREILFVPDENLGSWVIEQTGRPMTLWRGSCHVHMEFTAHAIGGIKEKHPGAVVVAHPECTRSVRLLADEVCSTEKMVGFCRDSAADTFIIVTESGLLHRLRREVPGKTFVAGPTDACACSDCRYMKMNTLEKLHSALLDLSPRIEIDETVRDRAERPIRRMLEWSRE